MIRVQIKLFWILSGSFLSRRCLIFKVLFLHSQATRTRSSLSSALQLYYNFFRLSTPFLSFFEKLFKPFPKLLKSCTFARRSFLATFTYYHLFRPLSTGFVTPYQVFHFLQNTVFTIYIIYIIYNALNDVVCPPFRQNIIRANSITLIIIV